MKNNYSLAVIALVSSAQAVNPFRYQYVADEDVVIPISESLIQEEEDV
jgi:hypothetical protein